MPQHSTDHRSGHSGSCVLITGTLTAAVTLAMLTTSAQAFDARSIALGGSAVAHGIGVNGAIENPASLTGMKRRGDTAHFLLGAAIDARDHGELVEILLDDDNRDLADDLEAEIENVSGSSIEPECSTAAFIPPTQNTVCLRGTQQLAVLADDAISLLNDIDGQPIEALGEGQTGFAVTNTPLPFAVHLGARATGYGVVNVDDNDRQYVDDFVTIMEDDEVTFGEIDSSARFTIENGTFNVDQPEDVISSTGEGAMMSRVQLGVSLATSVELADYSVDLGVTPKFSRLTAMGLQAQLSETFNDSSVPFEDQLEDSEVEESSFTFDIGASTQLPALPVRLSAVLRNVVPESIETNNGFEFETTPQLIVGALHQRENLSLMASLAINTAELDGIDTHPVALGVEYDTGLLAVRGGLSADLGRDDDVVALSAGIKLGPLEVGGRLSGVNQGQIGAQLSFGF